MVFQWFSIDFVTIGHILIIFFDLVDIAGGADPSWFHTRVFVLQCREHR